MAQGRQILEAGALKVKIQDSPLQIRVLDPNGQPILQDYPEHPVEFHGHRFACGKIFAPLKLLKINPVTG